MCYAVDVILVDTQDARLSPVAVLYGMSGNIFQFRMGPRIHTDNVSCHYNG